jgi:uncharacterized protein
MHYHIILTERCNLQCKYCYGKSMEEFDNGLEEKFKFDYNEPCTSNIKITKLKEFISKDPKAVIVFYGGEPLLKIPKIKEIIENINVPFRMQTNGQLLDKLEPKYLNSITKILISIDGNRETTNLYRGKNTYEKLTENIKLMKKNNYQGELIARMTVAQDNPDICKNVQDILKTKLFDSVHWQLDVGFYRNDFQKEKIQKFFSSYNTSISNLINFWIKQMQEGKVIKLYPFIAIVKDLLSPNPDKAKIRCGAGHKGYAISTSGKVVACPIMNNIEDFKAGDLNTSPSNLKKFQIQECNNCTHQNLCGGRCLYWRKSSLWPKEGDELICNSIKHYIDKIKIQMPKIKELIKEGKIKESDFDYEKYFGPEIIP